MIFEKEDSLEEQYFQVWTPLVHFPIATFKYVNFLKIGTVVKILIRNKSYLGIIISITSKPEFKVIKLEPTNWNFSESFINFLNKFTQINMTCHSYIVKTLLKNFGTKIKIPNFSEKIIKNTIVLSSEQENARAKIKDGINLLWGVTGSGKTEIYFSMIIDIINEGGQALLLLPEIAITQSLYGRFKERFNIESILWSSSSKNKKKFMEIYSGKPILIIGSRSTIFLPFKNLKIIVVDEEHDKTFYQTQEPSYNCRDMAVLLCSILKIPLILGSATPSLESYFNSLNGKYNLIKLENRYNTKSLPVVKSIKTFEILAKETISEVSKALNNGGQVIFYLNRRGFGQIVTCKKCCYRMICPNCESFLVFHKNQFYLLCHKCNKKFQANSCLQCGNINTIFAYGIGVEKMEEILQKNWPDKNIEILSSDTCYNEKKIQEKIEKIKNKEVDIIVGTQILSKGHDFPDIALVVIVSMDNNSLDFRAHESIFQNLIQISGRAGRGQIAGSVIIQEFKENILIEYLKNYDYEGFLNRELEERKKWKLPPFTRIVNIECKKKDVYLKILKILKDTSLDSHLSGTKELVKKKSLDFGEERANSLEFHREKSETFAQEKLKTFRLENRKVSLEENRKVSLKEKYFLYENYEDLKIIVKVNRLEAMELIKFLNEVKNDFKNLAHFQLDPL